MRWVSAMINQLPRWVELGGFFLTLVAGVVNAIALLGFNHQGVSHLSGSSTLLGVELASGNYSAVVHLALIVGSFVAGAMISGFVIGNESLKLGGRYILALLAEAIMLIIAMHYLKQDSNVGHYLASAACGLQNAMTSSYSGAVVRTTHVTGIFTDLGIMIGLFFRGKNADRRRVVLYIILLFGFVVGGTIGAVLFNHFRFSAILLPAVMCLVMALVYYIYWYRVQRYPG